MERLEGAVKAVREAGITDWKSFLVENISSEDDAYEKTMELMKREDRPTAIFVFNDYMAYGVYRGITKSGLRVPEDISVVGFDDIHQVKYLDPPLTTLRHSLIDNSDMIFGKLMEQIRTQTCAGRSVEYFKGRMVERESVQTIR